MATVALNSRKLQWSQPIGINHYFCPGRRELYEDYFQKDPQSPLSRNARVLGEFLLYSMAKIFNKRNAGLSPEMMGALADESSYASYRMECVKKVLDAAETYGVKWQNRDVLDLGCFDGAISAAYLDAGAETVVGVDIDEPAILRARSRFSNPRLRFVASDVTTIPIEDNSVDTILSYDVFEHIQHPSRILKECHRVLRPGGQLLVGTWGWYHPFAPHLWSIMPVPYSHVFFSERTLLRTCRQIYKSDWYVPNMHDFDSDGKRIEDKFTHESIPESYLNKMLIRDFDRCFKASPFSYKIHPQRFSTPLAAWTRPLLHVPLIKEFLTAYIWVVFEKTLVRQSHNQRLVSSTDR